MNKQNITLSIPKDIIQKVKLLAVKRGTSISGLMRDVLEEMVNQEEGYQAAHRRHMAILDQGVDLDTQGTIRWKREDLHAR